MALPPLHCPLLPLPLPFQLPHEPVRTWIYSSPPALFPLVPALFMLLAFYLLPGGPTGTIMWQWLCPHLSLAPGTEPPPGLHYLFSGSPGAQCSCPCAWPAWMTFSSDKTIMRGTWDDRVGEAIGRFSRDQDEGDPSGISWVTGGGRLSGLHSPDLDWASDPGLIAPASFPMRQGRVVHSCF